MSRNPSKTFQMPGTKVPKGPKAPGRGVNLPGPRPPAKSQLSGNDMTIRTLGAGAKIARTMKTKTKKKVTPKG